MDVDAVPVAAIFRLLSTAAVAADAAVLRHRDVVLLHLLRDDRHVCLCGEDLAA